MIIWNASGVLKPGIESVSNRDKEGLKNEGARRKLLLPAVKNPLVLLSGGKKKRLLLKQRKRIAKIAKRK